jgi:hypothetical protein
MKKIVTVTEVEGQGLEALLGQKVTIFCMNYIYAGLLEGVNSTDILLRDAYVVYETGAFSAGTYKDAQKISSEWRIRTSAIESYGVINA